MEPSAYDVPESWHEELRVTRVDLGSSRGILLRGTHLLCDANRQLSAILLRLVDERWVSMFDSAQTPVAESFTFGPAVTNGIEDLTIVTNVSVQADERVRFRFNGHAYRQVPN